MSDYDDWKTNEPDDALPGAEPELCGYCEHPESRHRENECQGDDLACDCIGFQS